MQLRKIVTDQNRIIDQYGEDCFFVIRFLMVSLELLLPLGLVAIPVLIPVYCTASSPPRASGLDQLGISSIQTSQNIQCWIITLVVFISNLHICRILFNEVKTVVRIRQNHLHRLMQAPWTTTILVTGIPSEKRNEEALAADFSVYNGGPNSIYLLNTTRFHANDAGLTDMGSLKGKPRGPQDHDSRNRFQAIKEIISRAKETYLPSRWARSLRGKANRSRNTALLQFSSVFTAHLMLQSQVSTDPFAMKAYLLDDAKILDRLHDGQDICPKPFKDLVIRVLLNGLSVFWAIPISLTGLLSQLVYLEPISSQLTKLSEGQMAAIQGLLPQIALALLMCGFPIIMQWIIKHTTTFQLSVRELLIQKHYFFFLYVQVFLVVSLSSSVTTMIPDIVENVQSVSTILADNLPKASNYFYSYLLLQAVTQCVMVFFQLPDSLLFYLRPHSGIARTRTIQWSLLYPVLTNLLCICISADHCRCVGFTDRSIGIIFTIISPLILAVGVIVFGAFLIAYSYQAIYVVRTGVETAGLLYWQALQHLFIAIYTMDVFVIGLFVLRGATGPTVVTSVVLILVGLLQRYILVTYRKLVMYVSALNFKAQHK